MKKILFILVTILSFCSSIAQTNTFPSSGNVGIGTTSPSYLLDLHGSGATLNLNGTPWGNSGASLNLLGWAASYKNWKITTALFSTGLDFVPSNTAGGTSFTSPVMTLLEDGKLGIGTTAPSSQLHISSVYPFTGSLRVGGDNSTAFGVLTEYTQYGSTTGSIYCSPGYSNNSSLFKLGVNGNNNQIVMRGDGNIGIGTENPNVAKFQIASTPVYPLLSTGLAQFYVVDPGTNGGIKFAINNASDIQGFGAPYRHGISAGGSESLAFLTNNGVRVVIDLNGKVGIGTTAPSEKLSVNGNISTKKCIVTQTGWSDYVFNDDYKLRPLNQVEKFIKENKHLPDVPSVKEVEEKGIDLGANQAVLLKKIEELTLYMIDLKKENRQQQMEIQQLKKQIKIK